MSNLLKADFKRVFKDKLLFITAMIGIGFAIFTPLLYVVMFASLGVDEQPMIESLISGKGQFFTSFSMGNNLGLIAPVLIAIILCKDFSFGTVRNKIISGNSRTAVFLSMFTVCSVAIVAVMFLHAFITLGFCLIFFDYQATAFTLSDFWYFLISVIFEILVLLFVSALLSWLCVAMKNVGLVIVMYVAITLALTMIASIIQIVTSVVSATGDSKLLVDVLKTINRLNIGNAAQYIGMGTKYTLEDVLYLTLPSIVGALGFIGLGILRFRKRDLK